MSRADEASYVRGPKAGEVMAHTMGTTHKVYKTPDGWLGHKVILHAYAGAAFFNFGTAITVEVDRSAESTWNSTSKVLTVDATTGGRIPEDGHVDFDVDATMTYFAIESDTATAHWIGYPSSII